VKVTDPDPVELAMREIQRSDTEAAGPNPFAAAAADRAREILEQAPPNSVEVEKPPVPQLVGLPRESAIRLRWSLRDIYAKRTKLSPVSPGDLKTLMEMDLVEIQDGILLLTKEGHRAIE